ncbi:unnamed protein product, partial [marine sediment metagenome]
STYIADDVFYSLSRPPLKLVVERLGHGEDGRLMWQFQQTL